MRTIGIDLGVTAAHKALVLDEASGEMVSPLLSFHGRYQEIVDLVARAREGVEADHPVQAVMEPTGMAWYPVAVVLIRLGVTCFLVNGQRIRDLRRFYSRHSSSDRISPRVDRESLHPLLLPTREELACQRGCKQLDRLQKQMTAIKNRLQDTDRWAWPGLEQVIPDPHSTLARRFREECYDPARVVATGVAQLRELFVDVMSDTAEWRWLESLVQLAQEVLQLYGTDSFDYALLQEEVCREQRLLSQLEQEAWAVQQTVRSLYRQLHPGREVESLPGVGKEGQRSMSASSARWNASPPSSSSAVGTGWCRTAGKAESERAKGCTSRKLDRTWSSTLPT